MKKWREAAVRYFFIGKQKVVLFPTFKKNERKKKVVRNALKQCQIGCDIIWLIIVR